MNRTLSQKGRLTPSVRSVGLLTIIETIKKTHFEDDNDRGAKRGGGWRRGDDDDDDDDRAPFR